MIGQTKLVSKLKSYSIATLPHSILLVGEQGCGKHELVRFMSEHFSISVKDITDDISLETIENIYISSSVCIYTIDVTKINEKQQNIILKFLEEPTNNTYIVLMSTSKSIILDTVINRCVTFEFEAYTRDDLLQFLSFDADVDKLLYYCHTPGQILNTTVEKLNATIELADNIIDNIRRARYTNIFKITEKLNIKDSADKIDISLLYNVLSERLFLKYVDNHDKTLYKMYEALSESHKKFIDTRYNSEYLMDSLFDDLWSVCKE